MWWRFATKAANILNLLGDCRDDETSLAFSSSNRAWKTFPTFVFAFFERFHSISIFTTERRTLPARDKRGGQSGTLKQKKKHIKASFGRERKVFAQVKGDFSRPHFLFRWDVEVGLFASDVAIESPQRTSLRDHPVDDLEISHFYPASRLWSWFWTDEHQIVLIPIINRRGVQWKIGNRGQTSSMQVTKVIRE